MAWKLSFFSYDEPVFDLYNRKLQNGLFYNGSQECRYYMLTLKCQTSSMRDRKAIGYYSAGTLFQLNMATES